MRTSIPVGRSGRFSFSIRAIDCPLALRQNSLRGASETRQHPWVELGGIEPPSIRRRTPALRPFPTTRLTQSHRRVGCLGCPGLRHVFPCGQRSFTPSAVFPTVILRFCCRAAVNRPRAPFLVTMSLRHLTDQAARANCSSAILWVAPFSESEQLGSHERPATLTSKPVSPSGCTCAQATASSGSGGPASRHET